MFKFFRKHRLFFDVLAFIVFGLGSYFYFIGDFDSSKDKKMKLIGAIVFGIMALIKLTDSFKEFKRKKISTLK